MKTGIFTGTFDPFTIGHASIVRRALPLFDRIVIGVGVNTRKTFVYTVEQRVKAIADLYADEPKVEVKAFDDFAVDLAHREGANFIIRGLRNTQDFEYERDQANFNRRIGNVETLLLYNEPDMGSISSSAVRELMNFGRDVDEFLPKKE